MSEAEPREEAVFEAALKLPEDQRAAYLDRTCGDDPNLRRRVEVLLGAFERASGFMKEPAVSMPARTVTLTPTEKPGDRIGRYKLLEQIGEGGCGVVYVAEQEEPVRRRVALKVIKLGMDTKEVIARFDAERQALAMMEHPNIAKVLDAGATETGRPYFVMELVRGIKITDYCGEHRLSPRERLELFIQVCRAIQHAHQKGVIHRDIKPSNILVASDDGVPVPKVIDFGIAKATQGRLTDQTIYTAFEQFIGTPAYMSPEQAQLSMQDIDTRSDIYSLGVLLYELLTGTTPLDPKELLAKGLDEMRRTIREVEPVKPSTRLTQELNSRSEIRNPKSEIKSALPAPRSAIPSDLDWIVMKCLEKDRTRRYETANGLATDIARHLNNEPVVARPPSELYEFRKTFQRHKFGFAAATAVTTSLVIGLGIATTSFIREKEARQVAVTAQAEQARLRLKAEAEAVKNQRVSQFLGDMFNSIDPEAAKGRDTSLLRDMLDKTTKRLQDLTNQPDIEARLQNTLGRVYHLIGEPEKAEFMFRQALALRRELLGNEHPEVADSLDGLATDLWARNAAEADRPAREALAIRRKLFGNEHPVVAESLHLLALVLQQQGKSAEAESVILEALAIYRKAFGEQHLDVASALGTFSGIRLQQGRLAEAESMIREALAMEKKLSGKNRELDYPLYNLANALYEQGKLAEAESLFRESLGIRRERLPNEHPGVAVPMSSLATVLRRQGKFAEAEPFYRECLAIREKKVPDAWFTFYTRTLLGGSLLEQKKYTEAESLLLSGYNGMKQRETNIRDRYKVFSETLQYLVRLYEAKNQPDRAAEWKQTLSEFEREMAEKK